MHTVFVRIIYAPWLIQTAYLTGLVQAPGDLGAGNFFATRGVLVV